MLSVVGVSSIGALVFSDRPALAARTPAVISGNATASISYKCLTFPPPRRLECNVYFKPAESYLESKHPVSSLMFLELDNLR